MGQSCWARVQKIGARLGCLAGLKDAVELVPHSRPTPWASAIYANANHVEALPHLRNAPFYATKDLEQEIVAGHLLQESLEFCQEVSANEALHILQAPTPRAKGAYGLEEVDHGLSVRVGKASRFLTRSSFS